jgi:hypothetical protein
MNRRSREELRRWKTERPTQKSERQRTITNGYAEDSRKRNARWGRRRAKVRARIRRVVSPKAEEVRVNGGPRDTRAQSGQEGVTRGKRASEVAEDSEAGSTNTDVGEETYLYGKVREAEWETGRAMWPCKGRVTRTGIIAERERPTEGKRGAKRDSMLRYAARGRRKPSCDWKGRGSVQMADEAFRGAERDGRNGRWVWQIGWRQRFGRSRWIWRNGWRQRFGRNRWVWWIGWSPCLGDMRWVRRTGKRRRPCGMGELARSGRRFPGRRRGTTRKRHSDLRPVFSEGFNWRIPVDARLGGGGCHGENRPQAESAENGHFGGFRESV